MRINVVHHSLRLVGGGERVCVSLLKALDRTDHDVVLRCTEPPHGVDFAWGAGGRGAAAEGCEPCDEECKKAHVRLGRVGLDLVDTAAGSSLFRANGGDLLVVTDGGFLLEETDARRVVLYCNSALREEGRMDYLRSDRSFRGRIRYYRARKNDKKLARMMRADKIVLVPNSRDTMARIASLAGKATEDPVYPPVDLARFSARRSAEREHRVVTVARFAPEKNLLAAARIAGSTGAQWDVVGNVSLPYQRAYAEQVEQAAGPMARLHVNTGPADLLVAVAGAKAYLHASKETFGMSVVEAIAAGCIPVVPDNSAHPETVPFPELRYSSDVDAAGRLAGVLDGKFDHLLPGLHGHIEQFSSEAFQKGMLNVISKQEE